MEIHLHTAQYLKTRQHILFYLIDAIEGCAEAVVIKGRALISQRADGNLRNFLGYRAYLTRR